MFSINNRYRIVDEIGRGGMGVVYRALDRLARRDTEKMIALKQVTTPGKNLRFGTRSSAKTAVDLRLALAQEFKTLASLRHPNIISVLDYGFDADSVPFFTMELLRDARTLLRAAYPLAQSGKIDVLIQVLQALAYLHRRGIIHRDLKPGNVLVVPAADNALHVRVLDFGLAQAPDFRPGEQDFVAGTLKYIAPEVLRGQQITETSDLYAVGVMAYQLFTGKHPFETSDSTRFIEDLLSTMPDLSDSDMDPRLQLVMRRLLAKEPVDRYPNAHAVIEALRHATDYVPSGETRTTRESFLQAAQFVGRRAQLDLLTNALKHITAVHPMGSAWLVGGESGVGKSRLLDELRTLAMVEGVLVLRGQSVQSGGLPYRQWRDPIRRLVLDTLLTDMEAGILKEIVPDIEELLEREIPEIPSLEGAAAQQRLVLTIADVFVRQQRPVMLLMEDLQWSSESLDPLKLLLQFLGPLPLLIVGTYRDDERRDLPYELPGMHPMKLERLERAEVEALSTSMLGAAGQTPEVVDLIHRETEGNTFFIVEVVRALAEDAGQLDMVGAVTLPSRVMVGGMHAVVGRRLERVPEYARPLLRLAAVAGRQIDRMVIRQIAQLDEFAVNLDEWLVDCVEAAVLEIHEAHWRFAHDKLREGVLDQIQDRDRPTLHRYVAEALEKAHPNNPAYAVALVEHWLAAEDFQQAARHVVVVGDQALMSGASQEAIALLHHTLQGLPEGEEAAAQRARLNLLLGALHWRMSDYTYAANYYALSLEDARAAQDMLAVAEALNGLAFVDCLIDNYESARERAQEALRISQEIGEQRNRARALSNLGIVAESESDFIAAMDHYRESAAIFESLNDKRGLASTLNNLGTAADSHGDFAAAREHYQHSLELCREIGYQHGIATLLNNLGVVTERQGDSVTAQKYYLESLPISMSIGDRRGACHSLANLVFTSLHQDEIDAAYVYLERGLRLAQEVSLYYVLPHLFTGAARLFLLRGNMERCAQLARLVVTDADDDIDFRVMRFDPLWQLLRDAVPPGTLDGPHERPTTAEIDTAVVQLLEEVEAIRSASRSGNSKSEGENR